MCSNRLSIRQNFWQLLYMARKCTTKHENGWGAVDPSVRRDPR